MGDEQDGLGRIAQLALQPQLAGDVQVVVRLVEEQHLVGAAQQRLEDEALLLTAGQGTDLAPLRLLVRHAEGGHRAHVPDGLSRVPAGVAPVGQRLRVGQLGCLVVALHDGEFGRVHGQRRCPNQRPRHGHQQVPDGSLVPHRPDELRHHAQPAAGRDRSRIRFQLTGGELEQRALARPVRTHERHDVTLPHPEAGVGEQQPPVRQVIVDVRDLEMPHARHDGRRP